MKISAIITTYNRSELAKRAIISVIDQTYPSYQIIVIEDSSDSDIGEWINENHPKIIYTKNKQNLGLAGSRNIGIQLATSDWIAFLDDDDEWMPNRLEEQEKCYRNLKSEEKEGLACIQAGVKKIDEDGNIIGIQLPINDGLLKESIIINGASTPSSAFLFNKNALNEIGGFDELLVSGIDHDIWMKLAVAEYKTKALKKPLVKVYVDKNDTMMTNTPKRIKGIQQYINKWTPVYINWFGDRDGKKYAKKYYSNVISGLAGQKLANHQFKEFFQAFISIQHVVGLNIYLLSQSLIKIIKIYIAERIPFVRNKVKKRNLIGLNLE